VKLSFDIVGEVNVIIAKTQNILRAYWFKGRMDSFATAQFLNRKVTAEI